MFSGLPSNVISVLCLKDFWLKGEMALAGEEGVGTGGKCPSSKHVKKTWFQEKRAGVL